MSSSYLFGQNFEEIRKQHNRSNLFEDDEFRHEYSSICTSGDLPDYKWQRPHEISDFPVFFADGADRFDVEQGQLSNCWLVAALANLTLIPPLFERVVPSDQSSFNGDDYCGAFRFRFWQFGEWVEVVVDDYLPTKNGKLIFAHSDDKSEMWCPLLEKAYAKLMGSYEKLENGAVADAMTDFTGGFCEQYRLQNDTPPAFWRRLQRAMARKSLVALKLGADVDKATAKAGLYAHHAYSVTQLVEVKLGNRTEKLARVRNPWGSHEWKGAWSDNSKSWRSLDSAQRAELDLVVDNDGEFWMSFGDLVAHFQSIDICNLAPDEATEQLLAATGGERWNESVFRGEWIAGRTAGGVGSRFHENPQYLLRVTDPDEDDDDLCTVVVNLTQCDRRKSGQKLLNIGFAAYKLESAPTSKLSRDFFQETAPFVRSKKSDVNKQSWHFVERRSIVNRFQLHPGLYCIIPTTLMKNQNGEYILRIFTERHHSATG